jgi:transposase-like protein
MPKKYPPEFKADVVTVARRGDLTVPEVAVDLAVSEESVRRWVRQADIDESITGGQTSRAVRAGPVAAGESPAGHGERDPAPRGGLLRLLDAPKMKIPLVRDLAAEGFQCG